MKKLFTTTAISLLLAGSVSAGGPFSSNADVLSDPRDQAAGDQADVQGNQIDSSRPGDDEDAAGRGGRSGARNAKFADGD